MPNSKIKVLHHLRHLGLGGTEKTCELFLSYLDPQKFELHLVWENSGPRRDRFVRLKPELTMWNVSRDNPDSLNAVLQVVQPDIMHVYRSGFPEWPWPHAWVPHFVETNVFGFIDGDQRVSRSLFMSKWLMKHATGRLPEGMFPGRFDFVNNPVEEPYTDDMFSWREPGAIYLGRCGRPDNGIYHAINVRAAHLLRMQGYDIRFVVVAPPSNMINDLSRYGIPFHVIESTVEPLALSMFYNSIDIYAHGRADGETFGVNIAEAMMHGKPVVTHIAEPSFPGMGVFQAQTELVDHEINGFVSRNEPSEYMLYLKRLIDDQALAKRFGDAAREKATREYHAQVCADKLGRIYEELVNG